MPTFIVENSNETLKTQTPITKELKKFANNTIASFSDMSEKNLKRMKKLVNDDNINFNVLKRWKHDLSKAQSRRKTPNGEFIYQCTGGVKGQEFCDQAMSAIRRKLNANNIVKDVKPEKPSLPKIVDNSVTKVSTVKPTNESLIFYINEEQIINLKK